VHHQKDSREVRPHKKLAAIYDKQKLFLEISALKLTCKITEAFISNASFITTSKNVNLLTIMRML